MRLHAALAVLMAAFLGSLPAYAQRADWGDLPDTHTALEVYEADTTAAAVVLFDYGEARVNDRFQVEFERHRRVKLLDEAGYDQATVSFTIYVEDRAQRATGIKGQTFVPQGNGDYRRVKMDGDAIFRERVGEDYERITFTLPALEPGAIVEYRYRVRSDNPFWFPAWRFQDEVPVLHSEFEGIVPRVLSYVHRKQGYLPFDVEEQEEINHFDGEAMRYRWVRTDVPALRDEPYMTTTEDYVHKIDFQLAEYYNPNYGVVKVLNTWEKLAQDLDENARFGRVLRSTGDIRRETERLTAGLTTPVEKLHAIYDFARSSLSCDGRRGFTSDVTSLDETLRTRTGSAPDLNLLLLQMLRAADIDAQPALISTRDHGRVQRAYPLVDQFNYLLVMAQVGSTVHWLDATEPMQPLGMLPPETLAGIAWVPDRSEPRWVRVTPPAAPSARVATLDGHLTESGALVAGLRLKADGYDALWMRHALRDNGTEAFVQDYVVDDLVGVVVDSVRVKALDDVDAPLEVYAYVHVDAYAQAVGELLFFNPAILQRVVENPFSTPTRSFPVDFGYARQRRLTAQIRLPDGYVLDEMPEPVRFRFGSDGTRYTRQVASSDGRLVLRSRLDQQGRSVDPPQYPDLRAFFDRVVAAEEEVVVLKRGAPVSEVAEPLPADSAEDAAEGGE